MLALIRHGWMIGKNGLACIRMEGSAITTTRRLGNYDPPKARSAVQAHEANALLWCLRVRLLP